MQSLRWYASRFRAMSGREVLWRLTSRVRASADRLAASRHSELIVLPRIADGNGRALATDERVVGRLPAVSDGAECSADVRAWRDAVVARAERICRNHLTIFRANRDAGPKVQWNYEYEANRPTPMVSSSGIDYRDHQITGDAKVAWEPSRHSHLVVLGRAYRLTGERRFAEKVVEQITSWIRQCPYGIGMQWRSPLELAIRLINWAWSLELIAPSGTVSREVREQILGTAYRHLREISRNYSRYSSANNHVVGEAAGVFIAASYFCSLKSASAWKAEARDILLREVEAQTFEDGGHAELATGYHLFVLEFFLLAGLAARNLGQDFPSAYWERLERMFGYVSALAEGGDAPPMLGDCDDGYVLDVSDGEDRARDLLAVGAALYGRRDFKAECGDRGEAVYWLLGEAGYEASGKLRVAEGYEPIVSRAFPQTGYYVLQSGHRGQEDRISATLDCGALGFGKIAAHGHADALSFTLRAFGEDVVVDPGTYDYFTYPAWRDYFRSTAAHNTVVVDGHEQSVTLGAFLWGRRAVARCLKWEPDAYGGTVVGEHDGYSRLADPVIHRRALSLDAGASELTVMDELSARGQHEATAYIHLAEHCQVQATEGNRFGVGCRRGSLVFHFDPRLEIVVVKGGESPRLGWVSRGYHHKVPSATFAARCRWSGKLSLLTRIVVGPASG